MFPSVLLVLFQPAVFALDCPNPFHLCLVESMHMFLKGLHENIHEGAVASLPAGDVATLNRRVQSLQAYGDLHAPSGPASTLPKMTANNMRALFTVFPIMFYRLNESPELNRGTAI